MTILETESKWDNQLNAACLAMVTKKCVNFAILFVSCLYSHRRASLDTKCVPQAYNRTLN
jgi:hypothetical protein